MVLCHARGMCRTPGDSSENWTRRFENVINATKPPERTVQTASTGVKGPIQPTCSPLPKLLSIPTGAMLDSKEKSDSEHSPLYENIFPISSFTAHLLCLLGWVFSHLLFHVIFGVFPTSAECYEKLRLLFSFSCLQNSLKYFRAGANQSRGVTTTSQMREIRVFSISLKK